MQDSISRRVARLRFTKSLVSSTRGAKVADMNNQFRFFPSLRGAPSQSTILALVFVFGLSPSPQAGTSAPLEVRGTVVNGENGSPIESAVVRLERLPGNVTVDEVTSDSNGKFAFSGAQKGEYIVRAEKTGYLDVFPGNGASHKVSNSAEGSAVGLSLIKACVITGRVFDSLGQPKRGARIVAMTRRGTDTGVRLQAEGDGMELDDRGEFRLYGLVPGLYTLAVVPTGEPNVASFAPLYFPGVVKADRAEFFELRSGETRSDIQVSLPVMQTEEIKGAVVGIPANWEDHAVAVSLLPSDGIAVVFQSVLANKDGHFLFPAVPPGSYRVFAYGPVIARGQGGPMAAGNSRQGAVNIEVIGGGLGELTIPLLRGVTVEVKGLLEGTSEPNPLCFANAEARLRPTDPAPVQYASFRARLTKQSSITGEAGIVREIPIGRYRVELETQSNPCFVQEVTFGHQRGPVVDLNESGTLVFVSSTHTGNITGTVVEEDGSTKAGMQVILVPSDEAPETLTLQTRSTQSDERGSFKLQQIPPGRYRILAVPTATSNKYLDPLFWDQHGVREVQVRRDATVETELRVVR